MVNVLNCYSPRIVRNTLFCCHALLHGKVVMSRGMLSQRGESQMTRIRFAYACSLASLATVLLGSTAFPEFALAQTAATNATTTATTGNRSRTIDPGVRGGPAGAGDALPGLNDAEKAFFEVAKEVF